MDLSNDSNVQKNDDTNILQELKNTHLDEYIMGQQSAKQTNKKPPKIQQ